MSTRFSGTTLIEVIIAVVLMSIIVLGLGSINIFSHFHVTNSERRAKLQNDASQILEHMSKEISRAIGNELIYGSDTVAKQQNISGDYAVWFYIDGSPANGQRDTINDHWIAYRFTAASANPADRYQIWYCPQCTNATCTQCNPAWGSERVTGNIRAFSVTWHTNAFTQLDENFVTAQVTACWLPAVAQSRDNPCINMASTIIMPSVSAN